MTEPIETVALVLKTAQGELIMQQRDHRLEGAAHLRGKITFFGGKIEAGEAPIEAAIREGYEELELQTETSDFIPRGKLQKYLPAHGDDHAVHFLEYRQPIDPRSFHVHEGDGYVLVRDQAQANTLNLGAFARDWVRAYFHDARAPYSERSLIQKLGYQTGEAIDTVDAPEWFLEYLRGNGIHAHAKLPAQWLHLFMTRREQLDHFLMHLKFNEIQKGLWVSWPKKGSQLHTDLTEQDLRDLILPYGWVDVKVCAIDDTWSGLKFVRRKQTAM